jgi:hypothetical protein
VKDFSHPRFSTDAIAPVNPLTLDIGNYLGGAAAPSQDDALTLEEITKRIAFFQNATLANKAVRDHLDDPAVADPTQNPNYNPILEQVRLSRPVHRLGKQNFVNVCKTGALLSLHQLLNFTVEGIMPLVLSHPRVSLVLKEKDKKATNTKEYIEAYIDATYKRLKSQKFKLDAQDSPITDQEVDKAELNAQIRRDVIVANFTTVWVEKLEKEIKSIIESIVSIDIKAIAYHVDQRVGTDKTVFVIIGPHMGANYGHIHLILHPSIQWHPNYYVLPNAATFFYRGTYEANRPWVQKKAWTDGAKDDFLASKFHPIAPLTHEMQALDLIARTAKAKQKKPTEVKLADVNEWWQGIDSHNVFEGHLPYQVPVSFIEAVVMSEDIWKSLDATEQTMVSNLFPGKIVKTKNEAESQKKAEERTVAPHLDSFQGFCFILAPSTQKGQELFVPLRLVTTAKTGQACIYFEATGSEFALCLVNQEKLGDDRNSLSVVFKGNKVSVAPLPPLPAYEGGDDVKRESDSKFNNGLDKHSPIQYVVISTYQKKRGGPRAVAARLY